MRLSILFIAASWLFCAAMLALFYMSMPGPAALAMMTYLFCAWMAWNTLEDEDGQAC